MNSAERRRLLRDLERQGFTWELSGGGHCKIRKGGAVVVTFSQSPSDHRAAKNAMSYLRRAGFDPDAGRRRKPRRGGPT